jgi:hypothetical protein
MKTDRQASPATKKKSTKMKGSSVNYRHPKHAIRNDPLFSATQATLEKQNL